MTHLVGLATIWLAGLVVGIAGLIHAAKMMLGIVAAASRELRLQCASFKSGAIELLEEAREWREVFGSTERKQFVNPTGISKSGTPIEPSATQDAGAPRLPKKDLGAT